MRPGIFIRQATGKDLPSASHWVERTRATKLHQRKQI